MEVASRNRGGTFANGGLVTGGVVDIDAIHEALKLCKKPPVSPEEFAAARRAMWPTEDVYKVHREAANDDSSPYTRNLADQSTPNLISDAEDRAKAADLADKALAALTQREQDVIHCLYGFEIGRPMSAVDTAEYLGMAPGTVWALHHRARRKMRAALGVEKPEVRWRARETWQVRDRRSGSLVAVGEFAYYEGTGTDRKVVMMTRDGERQYNAFAYRIVRKRVTK